MNRIILTGDKHYSREFESLSFRHFPWGRELDRSDFIIILGDFGIVWDNSKEENYWLDWFNDKPWTTLFIDGNHQNFPLLYTYPIEEWHGGHTHVLRPNIRHLMRGDIFDLNNRKVFCFGGATSRDKHLRKEGKTWWKEEMPTVEEMQHGVDNLIDNNFKVDYILTHTPPNSVIDSVDKWFPEHDSLTNYLEKIINQQVDFKQWFCGHMHEDRTINEKYFLLYNDFIEVLEDGTLKTIESIGW